MLREYIEEGLIQKAVLTFFFIRQNFFISVLTEIKDKNRIPSL